MIYTNKLEKSRKNIEKKDANDNIEINTEMEKNSTETEKPKVKETNIVASDKIEKVIVKKNGINISAKKNVRKDGVTK